MVPQFMEMKKTSKKAKKSDIMRRLVKKAKKAC